MREKRFNKKPECSVQSAPFPTEVTCPDCGDEIEIWSDEDRTACKLCGYQPYGHENQIN